MNLFMHILAAFPFPKNDLDCRHGWTVDPCRYPPQSQNLRTLHYEVHAYVSSLQITRGSTFSFTILRRIPCLQLRRPWKASLVEGVDQGPLRSEGGSQRKVARRGLMFGHTDVTGNEIVTCSLCGTAVSFAMDAKEVR